jgi:hypothetical protein
VGNSEEENEPGSTGLCLAIHLRVTLASMFVSAQFDLGVCPPVEATHIGCHLTVCRYLCMEDSIWRRCVVGMLTDIELVLERLYPLIECCSRELLDSLGLVVAIAGQQWKTNQVTRYKAVVSGR